MNLFVETRGDDNTDYAFWVDGDLQFDTRDEAVYHEALALPALTLARAARTDSNAPMRVLICGGGDGLALREVVRFPGVTHVDLVDYSEEIVEMGRTRFAAQNHHAFDDSRAHVHIADAWEFLQTVAVPYDVILCDFTTPRHTDDTRIMSREWYERVASALAPHGIAAINGVSPQTTPEAFWCLRRTIRAAHLSAVPFRACIPSFRDQGYGTWAFFLAGKHKLRRADLRALSACPVQTVTDLGALWQSAAFSAKERAIEARVPVHTLDQPCLLPLLLNPGKAANEARAELPPLEQLLSAVPVLHPHHTRVMVEALAEQVVGSIHALDLRKLIDALLDRAGSLPATLRRELTQLREFLQTRDLPRFPDWHVWAHRLFAVIAVIMMLANLVAPDNAFGKGTHGLGHASVSRGIGSSSGRSFGRSGSFSRSGPSGFVSSNRAAGGSFGRPSAGAFRPSEPITGGGFRGGFQRNQPTDIFGTTYAPRTFVYYHVGYHGGGGYSNNYGTTQSGIANPSNQESSQQARFVADDDMLVMDNGDVVLTLSDTAFIVVSGGTVTLHTTGTAEPLMTLYADPELFDNITARLRDQKTGLQSEIATRKEWLTWVGWTRPVFSSVQSDEAELAALEDLNKRLDAVLVRVGSSPRKSPPVDLPADLAQNAIELFSNAGLLQDGRIALVDEAGVYRFTDGTTLTGADGNKEPAPPGLSAAFVSVLTKLDKEFTADISELGADAIALQRDKVALDTDLKEYTALYNANGASYEVDYGTDTLSAQEALNRTNADLAQNAKDVEEVGKQQTSLTAQIVRLKTAADAFRAVAPSPTTGAAPPANGMPIP